MKATTVNTIAYVVPIDKTDVSNTQQAYIFDKKTLDDKQELSATSK